MFARPWIVLVAAIVFASFAAIGTMFLEFRSDERVFFGAANPHLERLEEFEARYGRENTILVLVQTAEEDLFTSERLEALDRITEEMWTAPMAKRVDGPTNFQIAVGNREGVMLDRLWRQGDPTDSESLTQIQNWARQEPLLMGRLLSDDMRSGLIATKYRIPSDMASNAATTVMADVTERVERWRKEYSDLTFSISGSLALDHAFGDASARDGSTLIPVMFVVLLVLLGILIASSVPVIAGFFVIGGAIGSALGVGGFLGIPLTSVSVAAPFIITIVALCDTIHLAFSASKARQSGLEKREAVLLGASRSAWPIFLTSATTAVGFFSLMLSESPPFAHLGILCGLGSMFAWVYSMTITPALLIMLPWRDGKGLLRFSAVFGRIAGWAAMRPWRTVGWVLLPVLAAIAFIPNNEIDDRYIRYFDDRFEFRRDADALNSVFGGFYTLEYDLPAAAEDGVSNPDYLAAVDKLATWLRTQPEVTHVSSHADRIKMINRAMMDGNESAYITPTDSAVSSQLLAMYEMQLPYGMDLREQLNAARTTSRMTVSLSDLSTGQTLDLAKRTNQWIASEAPILNSGAAATGTTLLFSHIGMRNIYNMLFGTVIVFFFVAGILLLAFRNVWITVVSMVANIVPGLAAIGGWGLLIGEVGMAVATIVAVTLGIVVDDTIHITTAMRRAQQKGLASVEAATEALAEVGPGVFATTLCLVAGFFILALSGFQINAWLGLMTGIVTLIAFIFDLFFIPAALTLISKTRENHAL